MTDDALREFVGYVMKRAFNVIQSDLNATLANHGLRMVTFSALSVIDENAGLRQSDLAQILSMERPNIVVIIDDLERSDLIVRDRSKSDRRAYSLRITAKGQAVLARARNDVRDHDRRMTQGMSEADRAVLSAALTLIETNGKPNHDDQPLSHP